MRLVFFVLFLVTHFSIVTTAAEKPMNWLCEVQDPSWPWPKKSEVVISLAEPTVTRIDYFSDDNGGHRANPEELITPTSVSTYKVDRARCTIRSGFRQGQFVDLYDFFFECKGLQGSFSINFRDATGFYGQQLTGMGVQKNFSMEKCRSML